MNKSLQTYDTAIIKILKSKVIAKMSCQIQIAFSNNAVT